MARAATLHCMVGCAIGEIAGMVLGAVYGLSNHTTIFLAIILAFVFGFALSTLPLVNAGLSTWQALKIVAVADALSIATMELADNLVMAYVPGAMNATLVNPVFWLTMPLALFAGYLAAVPVNKWLLDRGQGHALTMKYHGNHHDHHEEHRHAH